MEGNLEVTTLNANDFQGNKIQTFSLSGIDQDFFTIDDENFKLNFKNPVDFENDQINYFVDVIALDDFGNSAIQTLAITIEDGKNNFFIRFFFIRYFMVFMFGMS